MPSWNIHIAHANQLLEKGVGCLDGVIYCPDAFLLGNVAPDVHLGYMVSHVSRKIRYCRTHQSYPGSLPIPSYLRFQRNFMRGLAPIDFLNDACDIPCNSRFYSGENLSPEMKRKLREFMVGIWCHLVCDHVYNRHTRIFLQAHKIPTGETARIRKQSDFDLFGRSLDMGRLPEKSEELYIVASAFKQYGFTRSDVDATLKVLQKIAEYNVKHHVSTPNYDMLDASFFSSAYGDALLTMRAGFMRNLKYH